MSQLTEEQKILIANVRRVAEQKVAPPAAEIDRKGEFNWDVVSVFWDLGLLQIIGREIMKKASRFK